MTRAMQVVSIRFGVEQLGLIHEEAEAENVSVSQYVRDAAWARAVMSATQRNSTQLEMWERLIRVIEEAGQDQLSGELRGLL